MDPKEESNNADGGMQALQSQSSLSPSSGSAQPSAQQPDALWKDASGDTALQSPHHHHHHATTGDGSFWQTVAGVAGNVLEWFDFSVFGSFADIIGDQFFPPQSGHSATVESFAIFGGAFLMRPIGGVIMGYIGDTYGRKKALVISIFLMAFPTFFMGCLPTYSLVGPLAIVLLILVRLLQGLSVGGQLMSSLVFTLENHDPAQWGLYGSYVMAAANFGTLLGGMAGFVLRASLTTPQLEAWGWRIPFLSGILVSLSGFYLRSHGGEDEDGHEAHGANKKKPPKMSLSQVPLNGSSEHSEGDDDEEAKETSNTMDRTETTTTAVAPDAPNPLSLAFSRGNARALLASSMVPMLWSAGFYLCFVWMAIYMEDLIETPVPGAFAVNSMSLLVSVCLFFPVAGMLSDRYGRRCIMTFGGVSLGVLAPVLMGMISKGHRMGAFWAQTYMGISLSCWGAPMTAWLVEAFEPSMRLTSVSVGYNLAQAIAGGTAPVLATVFVDAWGPTAPGWILFWLAVVSLVGLWVVAPPPPDLSTTSRGSTKRKGATKFTAVPTDHVEMTSVPPASVFRIDDDDDEEEENHEIL